MKRKVFAVLLLVLMLVPMVGTQAQEEPVRIGIVTDLSGGLAIYGIEFTNGFNLGLLYAAGIGPMDYDSIEAALADVTVAGRPVEVLYGDYGSEDPAAESDDAASVTRELIESQFADIIVGPPRSGAAVQVQALTSPDEYNVVFMGGPGASPAITGATFHPNTFRVCRNGFQDSLALARIPEEGSTYIILAQDNEFGRATAGGFDFSFPAAGIMPAAEGIFAPSDTVDFTQFLQQVIDSGADYLIPIWAGGSSITLFQQIDELGVLDSVTPIIGTNSNDIVVAAPAIPGIAYIVYNYTLPQTEINDWLTEQHIAAYSDVPDLFTECGFASAQALYLGLEASGGDPLPEALVPALEGLSFEGPKGTYTINAGDHQALAPQYVIQFDGVIEEVEIADGVSMMLPVYTLLEEIPAADVQPPCLLPEAYAERCAMDMMDG